MVTYTILCVDDEMANLESLDRCLRKEYKILSADSGPDALKILGREKVHLIISDQRMPDMTGVEFLTKSIQIQPEAIRILLTGFADLESVIEAINKGQIYRYVTKPWDPVELKNTVAQALDVYLMRETIQKQNDELQKANQELQSLDKLKTEFMLLVNHELRTPLTAITSYTQLFSEEALTPEQKLYLHRINKNVARLENLIQDTLLIMRLKSTQKNIDLHSIDLRKMLESIWQEYQTYYKDSDIKLSCKGSVPFLQMVNEKFIKIILEKIIRNCFQHSKAAGKVEFAMSETRQDWTIQASNEMEKPIDRTPEQLLNAFGKNENILNHTGGAGLGLAVVNSVAQLFSGVVDLQINGNKFVLKLTFPKSL